MQTRSLQVNQSGGCLNTAIIVKEEIPVTLVCVETHRPDLAEMVLDVCCERANFSAVKLLTSKASAKHAVPIPPINGIENYSRFVVQELHKYIETSHCLIVQTDGYVLNEGAWKPEFLTCDFIGALYPQFRNPGSLFRYSNGGFSLRSKKLLKYLADHPFGDDPHSEDHYITVRHARELHAAGMVFASDYDSEAFGYDGRNWNGSDWVSHAVPWQGSFGFHSWLTKLPVDVYRPSIFHHSGDWGDVIYALPTIKTMHGGVLWMSPENRYPFPCETRCKVTPEWVSNIAPLLAIQPYIWRVQYTPALPHSVDYDINRFRIPWKPPWKNDAWGSILQLHLRAFDLQYDEQEPWLVVDAPETIPGRDIVVNRTNRWHSNRFNFHNLIQQHHERMVFVGTEKEYFDFQLWCHPVTGIPFHPTANMLDLARVIAGARVFIGNQSVALAIAHGLVKPVIVECWSGNSNCELKRPGAIYGKHGTVEIPKQWLQ